ncbi:MAG: hypothetical protein Tsb0021_13580 [Chlamydiales bacterium]
MILNNESYTLRNALCWGLCTLHFNEATDLQKSRVYRYYHGAVCTAESLPILGQIVSLFECCVAKLYYAIHTHQGYIFNNSYISIYHDPSKIKINLNIFGHLISLERQPE